MRYTPKKQTVYSSWQAKRHVKLFHAALVGSDKKSAHKPTVHNLESVTQL